MNHQRSLRSIGMALCSLLLLLAALPVTSRAAVGPAPTPPRATITIDAIGTVQPNPGTVTISGTVTCPDPYAGYVSVGVQQRAGRLIISGLGFADIACIGETPWTVTLEGGNGIFKAGNADVSARYEVAAPGDPDLHGDETGRVVRLKAAR